MKQGEAGDVRGDARQAGMESPYLRYLFSVAVALTVGCMLLAAVLSPEFSLREHALSNLGVTWTDAGTTTTAVLFNGGLIAGGIIGVLAAGSAYRRARRRVDRIVLALVGLTLALMGLVGVFPQGERLHFPVAIGFFLLISITLCVDGWFLFRAGERRRGLLVVTGGTANIAAWVVWFAAAESPSEGLAIPELFGALMFTVWLVATAFRLFEA
jgi:hypothetical membrane protein